MFSSLVTSLSLLCLASRIMISHVSLFTCFITCLPFPFMWSMLAFLALCHFFFLLSFFCCIHASILRSRFLHPCFACLCFVRSFPCFLLWIHAYFLRSRSLPCVCLFSLCGFVIVDLCGHFVYSVHPFPFCGLFACNHVWLGVHLHDVWLDCHLRLSSFS